MSNEHEYVVLSVYGALCRTSSELGRGHKEGVGGLLVLTPSRIFNNPTSVCFKSFSSRFLKVQLSEEYGFVVCW